MSVEQQPPNTDTLPERPMGNFSLFYVLSHTFKHRIWSTEGENPETGENRRIAISRETLNTLWTLRDHTSFLRYPDAAEKMLVEWIGRVSVDPKVIDSLSGGLYGANPDPEIVYEFARMAQSQSAVKAGDETVRVPESTDIVPESILIDVVRSARGRIRQEAMSQPHYQKSIELKATRAQITPEQTEDYLLAWHSYDLYSMGYIMPKIKLGTEAEEKAVNTGLFQEIEDPVGILRESFGLDLKKK